MKEGVERFAKKHEQSIYIDVLPIADGGDGTIEALRAAAGGQLIPCRVQDSAGNRHDTNWLKSGNLAVAELASCCGIALLPKLDALKAHTKGLGEILSCIFADRSISQVVIALGGSASTDGGSGALAAMGARFFDLDGNSLNVCGGISLAGLGSCDLSLVMRLFQDRSIKVITDVTNPLLGERGAATIYGPQKGASSADIALLEAALARFADVLEGKCGRRLRDLEGAGAAGGTAFGLACAGATVAAGFAYVSELTNLRQRAEQADIIITGEGRTDLTSLQGKVIGRLHQLCSQSSKRLIVVSGSVEANLPAGIRAYSSTTGSGMAGGEEIAGTVQKALDELIAQQ